MSNVEVETIRPGIVLATMNRPERLNALSMQQVSEIKSALEEVSRDRACRAVILTGAGRAFCAGADLKDDRAAPGAEDMNRVGLVYKSQEHLAELMLMIRELQKPVIAAVNGAAVGGGFGICLVCDVRVASVSASFGSVYIKAGLSSCDMGTSYLLPRIVGAARAAELMLTGRIFDAAEAERIGLVHRVVQEDRLLDAALETAELIAENNEYGVWMTKQGLWANLDAPSLRHAMELENRTQVLGSFTENMTEAMEAFREGRKPRWKPL
jgi:enoyl-CoA hydratase